MIFEVLLFSFLAGSTVFVGGVFSYFFERTVYNRKTKIKVAHFLTAFATGVMLAAVCFVLIPKGMHNLEIGYVVFLFLLGAFIFYFLDDYIKRHSAQIPQVLAMLLDFVPESIALGALFVYDHKTGLLLAIFIALQNLPEAFSSYIELRASSLSRKVSLAVLFSFSFIGVVFSSIGYMFLNQSDTLTSSLMVFFFFFILYLIFQDIALSFITKNSRSIAIGVNLGFALSMLAQALT